ncbi:hypothetical protein BS47DRAFT_1396566 [Hydnum rufescens UP504]|uniref:Uncharacterized protein n=1 Tax=Hydnum rufescens UP504 TaxID=1448309 RepID=A0A9P6DQA4_9AGAM|nr:hypothetical protein BS47DRAFT_1396566 [Hydnum rufescens UP504]
MPTLSAQEALITDFPANESRPDSASLSAVSSSSASTSSLSSSSFSLSSTSAAESAEEHLHFYLQSMGQIQQFLCAIWNTQVLFANDTVPKVGQLELVLNFYKAGHTCHFW